MAIARVISWCRITTVALGFFLYSADYIQAQGTTYNYFFRVYFKDKGENSLINFQASDLLSQRAIARREKAGIIVPDYNDLPVTKDYINQVESLGFTLHCTSRWLNTGLFKTVSDTDMSQLLTLPFVESVKVVKRPSGKGVNADKLKLNMFQSGLPPYDRPVTLLNGNALHDAGYIGKGIIIAVLDGGFYKSDLISSLNHLFARNGIKGTYDFVSGNTFVYGFHNHGTAVLSVLAGKSPGDIEGSAPGADYYLLRTEDTGSEYPVEEDFWTAGAEYADSAGADIISSSLGYFNFDDPSMNYKFSDMNGRSTFVTRAADIAASKGIIVITSAGNERTGYWQRIIAPSDGDSVICAGAVDGNDIISSFSSAGPSADRRVKPDNVAQGVSVPVQVLETTFSRANGTSFSCPLLSGICACVLQAVPETKNMDLVSALHESADRAANPDSLYGYGLPDMVKVIEKLENKYIKIPQDQAVIGPNPFTENLKVTFRESPGSIDLGIYTISGTAIVRRSYPEYISRTFDIGDLVNSSQGFYIIRLKTSEKTITFKVSKINK